MTTNLQYCTPTPEFIIKLRWYMRNQKSLGALQRDIAVYAARHCLPNLLMYLEEHMGQAWVICNYLRDAGVSPLYVQYYEKILQS